MKGANLGSKGLGKHKLEVGGESVSRMELCVSGQEPDSLPHCSNGPPTLPGIHSSCPLGPCLQLFLTSTGGGARLFPHALLPAGHIQAHPHL